MVCKNEDFFYRQRSPQPIALSVLFWILCLSFWKFRIIYIHSLICMICFQSKWVDEKSVNINILIIAVNDRGISWTLSTLTFLIPFLLLSFHYVKDAHRMLAPLSRSAALFYFVIQFRIHLNVKRSKNKRYRR